MGVLEQDGVYEIISSTLGEIAEAISEPLMATLENIWRTD